MRRRRRSSRPPKIKLQKVKLAKSAVEKFAALAAGLLTISVVDRVEVLRSLLDWYDENLSVMLQIKSLTAEERVALERACKARKLGEGTNIDAEAEQAYRTALRLYHKVLGPDFKVPDMEAVYQRLDTEKDQLQQKESERLARWESTTKLLNTHFGDLLGLTWKVRRQVEPRSLDEKTVWISSAVADSLGKEILKGACLSVLLAEAEFAIKAAAIEMENGALVLDPDRFMALTSQVFQKLGSLGGVSAGRKKGQKVPVSPGTSLPSSPRVQRTRPSGLTSTDPFGVFRPNTCKAALASLLADHAWHDLVELRGICTQYNSSFGPIHHVLSDLRGKGRLVETSPDKKRFRVP